MKREKYVYGLGYKYECLHVRLKVMGLYLQSSICWFGEVLKL